MRSFFISLRLLAVLTVITGLLYPLAVWAIGHVFFRGAAEGSLVYQNSRLVGSALLAQKTTDPRYFWPRPSAGDYATVASGASNLAWTSARQTAAMAERRSQFGGGEAPADLLTASGSGLDPHVSPDAIRAQLARVVRARVLTPGQQHTLDDLIARRLEGGHISPARVNVLLLNLDLDHAFPLR